MREYLAEERGRLERDLSLASDELRKKVEAISTATSSS
jgi:hypothetical protein